MGLKVDVSRGLSYLNGWGPARPDLLMVYEQMRRSGYVLGGKYSIDLSSIWTERANELNLVYSNGDVEVCVH